MWKSATIVRGLDKDYGLDGRDGRVWILQTIILLTARGLPFLQLFRIAQNLIKIDAN